MYGEKGIQVYKLNIYFSIGLHVSHVVLEQILNLVDSKRVIKTTLFQLHIK